MRTIITTLLILFSFQTISAQTIIFSENMGTPSTTTTIIANVFQNNGLLSYSNGAQSSSADVRTTSASSSYATASAGGNIYFSSTSGTYGFSIEGINASNYHSLSLQFGYKKESSTTHASFSVDYWNGNSWVTLASTASELFNEAANVSAVWYLSKTLSLPTDAQINGLKIRFVKTGIGAIRIDDVKLTAFEVLPTVINNSVNTVTSISATFGGEVTATGGSNIIETGIVFSNTSINSNPLIGGIGVNKLVSTNPNLGLGIFFNDSGDILMPNVQYSYNAYAIKNTGGVGYGSQATFYTLAVTPLAPIVDTPSTTSLNIAINNDTNSSSTTYAIIETSTSNYVQIDGSLGVTAVYQTATNWGIKNIIGLSPSTTYTFKTVAKNGNGTVTQESGSSSITTLAMPTINTSGTLSALSTTYGTASSYTSFVFSGENLNGDVTISAPAGFEISITGNGITGYATTQTVSPISGNVSATTVYLRLAETNLFGAYSGDIVIESDGLIVNVPTTPSSVLKKELTISDISILDKPFDGNTVAVISGIPALNGMIGSDYIVLSIDNAVANFIDYTIGNDKVVVVSGYVISGSSSENYELIQPLGLTANITSSAGSDFTINSGSPTNENSNIDYRIYQGTQLSNTGSGVNGSIGVMGFYLRDGGEEPDADNLPTELTSLSFQVINPHLIKAARLFVGTSPRGEVVMVNGQSVINFTGLTNIIAPDDGQLAINLRVTFNSEVTDNEQFIFIINGATANPAGSMFASLDAGGINSVSDGDINRIEVVGNQIQFAQQPPSIVVLDTAMTPPPTIVIKDENGNIDLDLHNNVFIISSVFSSFFPFVPSQFTNGEYTFNDIINSHPGTGFYLTASSPYLTSVNSTTFTITTIQFPFFGIINPICEGTTFSLPTTSVNGINGTWSPEINNTQTTTYTFTPDIGQYATESTLTVVVNPKIVPLFNPVAPINIGNGLSPLPNISNNGIAGTWSPELDNTQTTIYTFTPNEGFCATQTTLTITVYDESDVVPTFTSVPPICIDADLYPLPTTSTNNITGTWSPELNNITTTTYTFTPDVGQNAVNTILTIVVNPLTEPTFNAVPAVDFNATMSSSLLPTTSINGITGTWNPPLNNKVTTTYLFTPDQGFCASATSLTIEVQQPPTTPVYPSEDIVIHNPDGSVDIIGASICLTDTKGELSVSSSGTPIYKVPIALPPGIKDVAPQLALEYSGSSVQGIAGMGWNLNGISSIIRVSSRLDLDGVIDPVDFDQLDRYSLDGQRLIAVSGNYGMPGAIYQTENYSNMKIEGVGTFGTIVGTPLYGPESFVVTFPDGSQAFYGAVIGSKGFTEWKINRWIDPQGNYIDYNYFSENNVTRLNKITWGKNVNSPLAFENSIEFYYKNRLRSEYSYIKGVEIATKNILSHITVKSEGQIFRTYTIGHENISSNYQRVKYILESAGDNSVSNPIYFDYNNTSNTLGEFVKSGSSTGSQIDNVDVSGDFDGNGSVDFVANDKVYLNPIDAGNNWYGINFIAADKYIPVSILENNKLNQFQSILTVKEDSNNNTYVVYSYNKSTNQMVLKSTINSGNFDYQYCRTNSNANSTAPYNPCPSASFNDNKTIKASFLEGDYDGDGLTEMIHVRPIVKRTTHPNFSFIKTYKADEYKSFFYDLKNNLVTERAGLNVLGGKANFTADFNGDGRTDILSVNKETSAYTVYQYNMQLGQLEVLFTGTFSENIMSGNNIKQIVFGDFNGDGKMDIMIPVQNNSKSWVLRLSTGSSFRYDLYSDFELYRPKWEGAPTANRVKIRTYRAADLNKDGKSDFITSEWESWSEGINNRDSRGYFYYKENIGSLNTKPIFAANQVKQVSSSYGDPIHCLVGEFKNPQSNFEFTLIQRGTIWKGEYNKDIEAEARLTKVREVKSKISTEISYKPLTASVGLGTVNDVYHSSTTELYPFTEMISVPSMKVVDKITVYYNGTGSFKSQLYKYFGLVVHSRGLGILGFKKIAKSSWFNTANPNKIWSCIQSNPQLLGQNIYEWSYTGDIHTSFASPPVTTSSSNDIGITINSFTSNVLSNGMRVIVPNKTIKKDFLTGLTNQTEYFYDTYWNVNRTLFTNAVGTKEIVNTLYNNPTGTGKLYAVGRVTQVNETVSNYGDTFTSEQKYTYHPTHTNLIKQLQKKGHNTDYITEEYEYDFYGNVIQKSISAPNVTTRITKDKYHIKGRFVIEKTDIEGFVSKFEYNRLGQVVKSVDPFNVTTITNYNNWGLITEITTTGASTSPKKTTITYYRDENANIITTTTNLVINEVNRIFTNRLGQTFKSTTKGFATNSWVSKVMEYDYLGRKVRESEPYIDTNPNVSTTAGTKWNYTRYDYLSRPYEIESYNGRIQSIVYEGLTTTTTDGPKTVEVTYDANGNKRIVKDNDETLNFNYYASGLQKETVYGNHTVTYNYDGWGRKTYMKDPSVSQTPYTNTYNNFGELLTATTPTGTSTITYSPTGRMMQKTSVGQNTNNQSTFTYNDKGLLLTETGTSNGKSFSYANTYNSLFELLSSKEVTPDNFTHVKSFTYDNQGRVLQEQTNSFMTNNPNVNNGNITIEYGYNTYNGILEQYKDVATGNILWKLNSTNERMQVLTGLFGNGIQVANTYDNDYYIKTINHADASNTALNIEYQFVRDRGTLNWRKNNVVGVLSWNEEFSYDNFERLTSWTDPTGASSNSYTSDGRIVENNAIGNYNYGGTSRYTRTSADLNANGEALYLTRTPQTISYNMFKNPISITEVTRGSVTFEYNMSGERTKSSVLAEDGTTVLKNKFYSGISEVEVIEKPNQVLQFITYLAGSPYTAAVALEKSYAASGSSYTENSKEFLYLHRDYQGTILAISGNDGVIKERRLFDPWGNLKKKYIGNTAVADADLGLVDFELLTDRGYTGHEHFFSVGIIHMNGRIYDPVLRSFLSPDPVLQAPENSQNYNRYAYCFNNPLLYTDTTGNIIETIGAAIIIGAIIGGVAYVGMAFYTGTFSWGGLAKSIVIGAASGAASFGVGNVINSLNVSICTATQTLTQAQINIMLTLPQAALHGIAQGFIQGVSGGDAGQTFLTAAISSVAAGGYGMAAGKFAGSGAGHVLFGTFAGGATASLAGGNFWEGAISGMTVSWLNHVAHLTIGKIEYKKTLAERFKKGNIDPNGKPNLTKEGALNLNKNVEGLEEAYVAGGKPNIRFDIKSNKYLGLTNWGDVNLNPSKLTTNLKFAAVLFHEYRHAWQYVSLNYYHWQKQYGYGGTDNPMERDAYWFQIKMGAGDFFEGYSRYVEHRNWTKDITYVKK